MTTRADDPETAPASEREAFWHRHGYERAMATTQHFAEMVRSLDDAQLRAPVPGLDWQAAEVVAHVASVFQRYTVNKRRATTVDEVATQNAEELAAIGRDVDALVDDMVGQLASLEPIIEHVEPDRAFEFHVGQPITIGGGWGNIIGELLAHGDDIARAAGLTWSIEGSDLEPFWRFTARVLPGWLTDAGRAATDRWDLDFGFPSGPVRLRFAEGQVHIDEPGPWQADHTITGHPVEITLQVPYGRRPVTDATVELLASRIQPI